MDPVEPRDLAPVEELTRCFFRATSPHLTHDEFARKWALALESPLRLFRSFPQAYYIDLTSVPAHHVPGRSGVCFGDLHPENFGFIRFAEGHRYVFNDLDDAGVGPVGLDALRYFTALELYGETRATRSLVDYFRDVMRDPARGRALPDAMVPDHDAVRARTLAKYAENGHLRFTKETRLSPPAPDDRRALLAALAAHPELARYEVRDAADRERAHGGSGGLHRMWVLARDGATGEDELLELKELAKPATAWGRAFTPIEDRVARVRDALWSGLTPRDHRTVAVGGAEFLVRSRLGRYDYDLAALTPARRRALFEVQITLMARHHRQLFHPSEYQHLDDWLQTSARTLRKRWLAVFARAKGDAGGRTRGA